MRVRSLIVLGMSGWAAVACGPRSMPARLVPTLTRDAALGLPPCEVRAVDTSAWRAERVADVGITFRVPPSYGRTQIAVRQRPGWGVDTWFRNGQPSHAVSVGLVRSGVQAERDAIERARYDGFRQCVDDTGEQTAEVTLHEGGGEGSHVGLSRLVAEWYFPGGRVVRLTGVASDSNSLREHFAIVRTVQFTDEPRFPAPCAAPFSCP